MAEAVARPKATSTQILASVGATIIFGMNVSYQVVMTSFPYIMKFMGITKVEASLMPTVVSVGTIIMALIGTKLIDKITPRWSMLCGTILVSLFLALNAIGLPYGLWVASGLLAGFGSALGATGAVAAIMRQYWGLASGSKWALVCGIQTCLVSGYTALMSFLWGVMDFQSAFWVIAALCFVLGVGANLICFRKPDAFIVDELQAAAQKALDAEESEKNAAKEEESVGWTFFESFKHAPIYFFTLAFLCGAVINGGISSFLTTFLTEGGVATTDAALLQSAFTLMGGFHILYCGFLQQRFGNKVYFIWFYGLCAVGFVLLAIWSGVSAGGMIAFLVIALLFVACMKPILSTTGVVAGDLFGNKEYTSFNSYGQAVTNAGRFVSSASTAAVMQFFGNAALCWLFCAMGICAAIFFLLADAFSPFAKRAAAARKAKYAKK